MEAVCRCGHCHWSAHHAMGARNSVGHLKNCEVLAAFVDGLLTILPWFLMVFECLSSWLSANFNIKKLHRGMTPRRTAGNRIRRRPTAGNEVREKWFVATQNTSKQNETKSYVWVCVCVCIEWSWLPSSCWYPYIDVLILVTLLGTALWLMVWTSSTTSSSVCLWQKPKVWIQGSVWC